MLAFLGTFLLTLFVALLAALQLADHFRATEKFIAVMLAIAAYTFASVVLLGITYSAARTRGAITAMAWLLAVGACILVAVPDGLELYRGRRLEDFTIERKEVEVALQFRARDPQSGRAGMGGGRAAPSRRLVHAAVHGAGDHGGGRGADRAGLSRILYQGATAAPAARFAGRRNAERRALNDGDRLG